MDDEIDTYKMKKPVFDGRLQAHNELHNDRSNAYLANAHGFYELAYDFARSYFSKTKYSINPKEWLGIELLFDRYSNLSMTIRNRNFTGMAKDSMRIQLRESFYKLMDMLMIQTKDFFISTSEEDETEFTDDEFRKGL